MFEFRKPRSFENRITDKIYYFHAEITVNYLFYISLHLFADKISCKALLEAPNDDSKVLNLLSETLQNIGKYQLQNY